MNELIISLIINGLLGVAMYFMKQANDNNKEQLNNQRQDIQHIKDNYFKREEFRDFKDELWTRLDKMENTFERRLHEVVKSP
jgi:uncharacterized membrane protein YraQ (UPF0718 family)